MLLLARYARFAAIILKVTDFTGIIYIFYRTAIFNILEITRGKNILHSNPSQKLRLVVAIKYLEPEFIQPSPNTPSRMLYLSCNIRI